MLRRSFRLWFAYVALIGVLTAAPRYAKAASGTWTSTVDGLWSDTTKWSGGTIADGANNTADFSTLDISDQTGVTGVAAVQVTFDAPHTLGHLKFGDTNTGTPGAWDVLEPTTTNILTLSDTTKPTITVSPLGPVGATLTDDATIRARLAGTNGFNKLGTGVATVTSTYDSATAANNLTGVVNVNDGTLRILAGSTFDFETTVDAAKLSFTVADNKHLDARAFVQNITAGLNTTIDGTSGLQFVSVGNGTTFNLSGGGLGASGNVAPVAGEGTIVGGTGARSITINNSSAAATGIGNIGGTVTGLTVNANLSGTGTTRLARDWTLNGGVTTLNLTGTRPDLAQSVVELRYNNGGAFNGTSFANATVNLTNVLVYPNQNTDGNEWTVGALNGDAASTIRGGDAGGGSSNLIIGNASNSVFAGTITTDAAVVTPAARSFNLTKQGTGTLTLSGSLTYSPIDANSLVSRGGVTRITGGTLKLTGTASLPAGIVGTLGDYYSTVDIRSGTILDVSGTSTTYQSSALQQTIGAGTIQGNYNHADGTIMPGNTSIVVNALIGTRPTQDTNPVAGTLTFNGNLQLNGGKYVFDMSGSNASGNDRIAVNGVTTLTSGQIDVNLTFVGGAPTAGQTYTVLTSTSFSGAASNIIVNYPGRGADPVPFVSGGNLQFTVPAGGAAANLVWKGNDPGNPSSWDNETTPNFLNTGTAAADKFFTNDTVTLNDTATTFGVVLNSDVSPASVTVNNTTAYTISGIRRIIGGGSVTKSGTGLLTMTTANTFTGGLTINGGAINRDATGGMGTGQITLNSGEIQTRAWTNAAPIAVNAATVNRITLLGGATAGASTTVAYNQDGLLSGSGTLEIFNDTNNAGLQVAQAMDIRNNGNTFSGTIRFTGPSRTAPRLTQLGAAGNNVAWDLGNGEVGTAGTGAGGSGSSLTTTVQSTTTANGSPHEIVAFRLGSITGGTFSQLGGFGSGAGVAPVRWEIGGLNTSTQFDGIVGDGNKGGTGDRTFANVTHILKEGTGTLTLTALNVYTGTTNVAQGTLSIAQAYLADTSNILVSTNGTFNLNFVGSDTVNALYIGGVAMAPGTYGATATNPGGHFTGTGTLTVSVTGPALLPGDFDGNKTVANADLAFWRRSFGAGAGGDADFDGDTDSNDFLIWQKNLGLTIPGVAVSGTVPEPSACMLLAIVAPMLAARARRRRS